MTESAFRAVNCPLEEVVYTGPGIGQPGPHLLPYNDAASSDCWRSPPAQGNSLASCPCAQDS